MFCNRKQSSNKFLVGYVVSSEVESVLYGQRTAAKTGIYGRYSRLEWTLSTLAELTKEGLATAAQFVFNGAKRY